MVERVCHPARSRTPGAPSSGGGLRPRHPAPPAARAPPVDEVPDRRARADEALDPWLRSGGHLRSGGCRPPVPAPPRRRLPVHGSGKWRGSTAGEIAPDASGGNAARLLTGGSARRATRCLTPFRQDLHQVWPTHDEATARGLAAGGVRRLASTAAAAVEASHSAPHAANHSSTPATGATARARSKTTSRSLVR